MEKFDLENFPVSESAKNMIASVSDGFYDNSYVGKWLYPDKAGAFAPAFVLCA